MDQLEKILHKSREYARDGRVLQALEEFELAREEATEMGIEIPEEIRREVESAAYTNGAELQLKIALGFMSEGRSGEAEKAVQRACSYAAYAGLSLSEN